MRDDPNTRYPLPPPPDMVRMPAAAPWDVPISDLCGLWLEVRCECGHVAFPPLRRMAADLGWKLTLRTIVPRISCASCRGRPGTIDLIEDAAATAKSGSTRRIALR